LLDRFEVRRRISPLVKGRSQPAFATLQGKSLHENPQGKDLLDGGASNIRKNKEKRPNKPMKPPTPCLCGEEHFYSSCLYLMESTRPAGWSPDPEILKRVNESLQKNPRLREKVEAAQNKLTKTRAGSKLLTPLSLYQIPFKNGRNRHSQPATMLVTHILLRQSSMSFTIVFYLTLRQQSTFAITFNGSLTIKKLRPRTILLLEILPFQF
jgi:hypothetical protein